MEHLWSQADATGDNRWQMRTARKRLKQAETVAVGCDQLPRGPDGKESMFATGCHGLPSTPFLKERRSISLLRKEDESREPEGPQDS